MGSPRNGNGKWNTIGRREWRRCHSEQGIGKYAGTPFAGGPSLRSPMLRGITQSDDYHLHKVCLNLMEPGDWKIA